MDAISLFGETYSVPKGSLHPPHLPTIEAVGEHIQSALVTMETVSMRQSISPDHVHTNTVRACPQHGTNVALQCVTEWTEVLRSIELETGKSKRQGQSQLIDLEQILFRLMKIRTQLSPNNVDVSLELL